MAQALLVSATLFLISACAGTREFVPPPPFDQSGLRARADVLVDDEFRISAAVPSVQESREIFGIDLSERNIQAVWLKIENFSDRPVLFLPTGLDPEYFAPHEVAFGFREGYSRDAEEELAFHVGRMNFFDPIKPGTAVSGFVYTNQDVGSKIVTVDLVGRKWARSFTLIAFIAESEREDEREEESVDGRARELLERVAATNWEKIEEESRLRDILEALPCCTLDQAGREAEPLNIVIIGKHFDVVRALLRRRFRSSTAVEPRYVFGRPQDWSVTKRDGWVAAQPHTVRLWMTAFRYRGQPVWVGQVSTPLGGRFRSAGDLESALLEPDLDESRIDLVQDMMFSQHLAKLGFVEGVGRASASDPRAMADGSSYWTDGLRAVMLFEPESYSLADIDFFPWERLIDHKHAAKFGAQ